MTNAIETTKREMYDHLESLKNIVAPHSVSSLYANRLEEFLESHLEQLRQQYEQMAATAHSRFETIHSLEQSGQEMASELRVTRQALESLKGERDAIRDKLQAFEFANKSAGEFLIDALRKVKNQRKTIKALRRAQEASKLEGATLASPSSSGTIPEGYGEPQEHIESSLRTVEGITYVSTIESGSGSSIYCTACNRLTEKCHVQA